MLNILLFYDKIYTGGYMQVAIKDIMVDVSIIYKNNKNIYFRFNNNTLVVTCNRFVTQKYIKELIQKNEDSLYKMYKKTLKEVESNLYFNYLGDKYTIVYDNVTKNPYFEGDMIFAKDEKTLNKFYDKECLRIFGIEVERISKYFDNIPSFSLKVRKMKTRWGVNNITRRTITLNSELLKKKVYLLDYVIIHELCHFYEANHSKRFWEHVSRYYPKYKEARKELRG